MGKTAFLFPGQGAQYAGMGKDFYETIPVCKKVMDLASEVTELNLPALCFTENEKLDITEYTQIAMLSVSAAILKAVEEQGVRPDVTAGLSLGEYAALVASGAMSLTDAFQVVRKRGIYMQEAVPVGGAMSAVMGMEAEKIEAICERTEGSVSIANYNCPGQIVITGEEGAVTRASKCLKDAGARRIIPLHVSGPFHSPMLSQAGERLREALRDVEIHDFSIPYVTNVTASYVREKEAVKELLVRQVSSSVRWQQCVEAMIAHGTEIFVEIGPGKTLSGFMRKINRDVTTYHIENREDFERVMVALK